MLAPEPPSLDGDGGMEVIFIEAHLLCPRYDLL